MKTFAELGFVYQRDGKKEFDAESIKLSKLANKQVVVKDYETGISTDQGPDRYVVLIEYEGRERKFFTNSQKMKQALDFAREHDGLPFQTTIEPLGGNGGYVFK